MIKKYALIFVAFLCSFFYGFGQSPWINEIHYDNAGTDANEGVEIAGVAGTDLSTYSLTAYNGSAGNFYDNISLSGTIPDEGMGYGAIFFSIAPFQNGSPDGISLDNTGTVIQFLSYEGNFTAVDGPASGMTSTNIGVSESSVTPLGESLQLVGTGCEYSSFSWTPATTSSYGSLNTGQTISCDAVDWCNIQWPNTPQTIFLGDSFNVYAQTYEPGVTEAAGQGGGVTAWIGFNTTNNNPDGGSGWTWVNTSYNVDAVNNDEYYADIGPSIPSTGTYYYASRFQLNGGLFVYGGSGGVWNNDSVQLTVDPHILDWCNLKHPENGSITTGDTFDVFAQVYETGVTDTPASQGANIEAWIGYSSADTDPSGAGWTWVNATYNPLCGTECGTPENNDEYYADIGTTLLAGTYYYASRFRIDGDVYYYGGYNAGGGGFWSSGVNVNSVLTVTDPSGSSCLEDGFDSVDGWNTQPGGNWTENADNGTYTGNGVYVDSGNSIAENKLGFNDVGDWFELPPIDNPLLFTYWGRLSSSPSGTNRMKVQVFDGGAWNDVVEHTSTLTTYVQYSANLSAYSSNTGVRIRLYRSEDDRSFYVDDIEVICVDCTPVHTITGFSPTLGPENTYVTITGTGYTAGTAVSFNGGPAIIESQTATELAVFVPTGVSTGVITVTESGCDIYSSSDFTIITGEESSCEGVVTATDLFISEVTDATYGALTYIEIYNGTGSSVDLSDYELEITYNGNSNNTSIASLSGTLANGDVHVVSTSTSGYTCSVPGGDASYADQSVGTFSGVDSARNDSDCITLYHSSTAIDVWGDCNDKNWRENLGVAIGDEGFNFRRLTSASFPSTTFSLVDWNIIDWSDGSSNSTCAENDYSDVGNYASGFPPTINTDPSASTSCDLTATLMVSATEGFVGGNSLVYQWYYHAPSDIGWTLVTNGTLYSGATSNTLTISNVLNTIDYQYYCQVRENNLSCYQASDATRLDIQRTIWYDNGSTIDWSNGTPTAGMIAVLDENYNSSSDGDIDACNLIINSGKVLTVGNSSYVRIVNDVINNGTITVQTRGAFVQDGDDGTAGIFDNSGGGSSNVLKTTATFNDAISGNYNYTYWSSPVIGSVINVVFPNPVGNRRFYFKGEEFLDAFKENGNDNTLVDGQDDIDDDDSDWIFASGLTMELGRGYAVTAVPTPSPGSNYTDSANFIGDFNTGNQSFTVYRNDSELDDNNWNFTGNPYPSAISADAFILQNVYLASPAGGFPTNTSGALDGAIYLWSQSIPADADTNGNENYNFSQSDYAVINLTGETAGNSGVLPTRNIPSGQGFFVSYSDDASTNGSFPIYSNAITYKNSMRVADNISNNQFFEVNNNNTFFNDEINSTLGEPNKLWIDLTSDNGVFNQILIGYVEGSTDGFDDMKFDAYKNLSSIIYSALYTFIEGEEKVFTIQGKDPSSLTLDEVIPLGFSTIISEPTLYRFSIPQMEGEFFNSNTIFVKDYLMGITHDLSESGYTFTSDIGEFNDRFEIVFVEDALGLGENELNGNDLMIIELPNGNVLFKLTGDHQMETIEITDLLGRTLYVLDGEGEAQRSFYLSNLSQATYLATVTLTDGRFITKKAIKRN